MSFWHEYRLRQKPKALLERWLVSLPFLAVGIVFIALGYDWSIIVGLALIGLAYLISI